MPPHFGLGSRSEASGRQLAEMGDAARQLWDLGTVALRAMTLDRSTQRSVADRLLVQGVPELLFIHRGRILLRTQGTQLGGCAPIPRGEGINGKQ